MKDEDKKLKTLYPGTTVRPFIIGTDPAQQQGPSPLGNGVLTQMDTRNTRIYDNWTLRCNYCLTPRENIFGVLCKDCQAEAEQLLRAKRKLIFVK